MKCPGIITKGGKKSGPVHCDGNLQTIRTLANGREVKRERRCPKCNGQYWTIEQIEDDVIKNKIDQENKYNILESEYNKFLEDAGKIRSVLKQFSGLLERA